jgi:hypothetical protein
MLAMTIDARSSETPEDENRVGESPFDIAGIRRDKNSSSSSGAEDDR